MLTKYNMNRHDTNILYYSIYDKWIPVTSSGPYGRHISVSVS